MMNLNYKNNLIKLTSLLLFLTYLVLLPLSSTVVHAAPTITVNPATGAFGVTVQVGGKGFTGRLATIYFDDKSIANNIAISDSGEFNYDLPIPRAFRGSHIIRISDNSNWSGSIATFEFQVRPRIAIFPTTATGNNDVTVTGNGFSKDEKDIRITWDDTTTLVAPVNADRAGSWSLIMPIPKTSKGEHFVGAFSSATTASEIEKIKFIVAPYVQVTPLSGPVGTQIMFYGWGFRGNEDGVTILWDGDIISTNIRAEPDGSLIVDGSKILNPGPSYTGDTRTSVFVPPSIKGQHIIGVYGSSFTPRGTFSDYTFEVIPQIKLEVEPDIKGSRINISGTGFNKNESVTITLDKAPTNIKATSDGNGSFICALVIPVSKGKQYTIGATGSSNSTAQASFTSTIEKTLPTEVKLLSPAHGEKLTIFNSVGDVILSTFKYLFGVFSYLNGTPLKSISAPKITFTWKGDGASLSNYVLQLASDRNFSAIALEKRISSSESYSLSENDYLGMGHYSWRVKATDNAGNESQWSQPSEFDVVSMSAIVGILSAAIAVLVIAAIVFGILMARANLGRF
jgi:hypothetical protein